jgi:hypothetical protein
VPGLFVNVAGHHARPRNNLNGVLALPSGSTYSLSVFDGFQGFRGSTLTLVASIVSASSTAALYWASVAERQIALPPVFRRMRCVAISNFLSEQRAATAPTVPKMRRRYVARSHRANRQA